MAHIIVRTTLDIAHALAARQACAGHLDVRVTEEGLAALTDEQATLLSTYADPEGTVFVYSQPARLPVTTVGWPGVVAGLDAVIAARAADAEKARAAREATVAEIVAMHDAGDIVRWTYEAADANHDACWELRYPLSSEYYEHPLIASWLPALRAECDARRAALRAAQVEHSEQVKRENAERTERACWEKSQRLDAQRAYVLSHEATFARHEVRAAKEDRDVSALLRARWDESLSRVLDPICATLVKAYDSKVRAGVPTGETYALYDALVAAAESLPSLARDGVILLEETTAEVGEIQRSDVDTRAKKETWRTTVGIKFSHPWFGSEELAFTAEAVPDFDAHDDDDEADDD